MGGDDASLADFNGVESVVVEAPLGHGVTQYYAEGDSPSPTFNEGITGQEGPESNPTNSNFTAQGYDDKQDESIGMRHRGRHSQSRKDRRNEASAMDRRGRRGRKYDDVATMDGSKANFSAANLPSTTAHKRRNARGRFVNQGPTSSRSSPQPKWAKAMFANMGGKNAEHNSEYSQIMGPTVEANEGGLHSPSSFDISWEDGSGQSSASMPPNEIHFAETHDADFTLEKPVKTGFMVAFGAGLFSLAAIAGTVLIGTLLGGNKQ